MNTFDDDSDKLDYSKPSKERDEAAVRLFIYLFDRFCHEEEVGDNDRFKVSMLFFLNWLQRSMPVMNSSEICEEIAVDMRLWGYVDDLVNNAQGPQQVSMIWPQVCLAHRPSPKHKLVNMHLVALFTWEDGSICPFSINTPAALAQAPGLTDATCASLLAQQVRGVVECLMNMGLDGLHDNQADNFGGNDHFNVMMGAFVHKIIPQLQPAYRPYALKYARLIQFLLKPPIPPSARPVQAPQKVLPPDQQRGGWSS